MIHCNFQNPLSFPFPLFCHTGGEQFFSDEETRDVDNRRQTRGVATGTVRRSEAKGKRNDDALDDDDDYWNARDRCDATGETGATRDGEEKCRGVGAEKDYCR